MFPVAVERLILNNDLDIINGLTLNILPFHSVPRLAMSLLEKPLVKFGTLGPRPRSRWQRRLQPPRRCSAWMYQASVQYPILTQVIMPLTPGRNTSNVIRHTTLSPTKSARRKRQEGLQELFMTLKVAPSFENCMLVSRHYREHRLTSCLCVSRTVKAGDNIEVLKQHLPDGWSLVSAAGQVGLIPESYYTVSGDRVPSPLYLSGDLLLALLYAVMVLIYGAGGFCCILLFRCHARRSGP